MKQRLLVFGLLTALLSPLSGCKRQTYEGAPEIRKAYIGPELGTSSATLHTATSVVPPKIQVIDPTTACLVVIYGAELGKRIPLGAGEVECGRSAQNGIPLDDDAVSRRHARFAWTGDSDPVLEPGTKKLHFGPFDVFKRMAAEGFENRDASLADFALVVVMEFHHPEGAFDLQRAGHNRRGFTCNIKQALNFHARRDLNEKRGLALNGQVSLSDAGLKRGELRLHTVEEAISA